MHGKLRGGTLPELGGNFRLCAVDQKGPFFPRVGPFLALLPFKGPYGKPLTGEGRSLREGSLTGRVAPFTKKDDEEAYGKAGPLWEALYGEGRSFEKEPKTQNPTDEPTQFFKNLRFGVILFGARLTLARGFNP